MGVVTIYRLAEQCFSLIEGGNPPAAASISLGEMKIACGQVINNLLKTDYLTVNGQLSELIPNGSVIGLYEGIVVEKYKSVSRAALPIKPLKLPRDIGVFSVFLSGEPDNEFIPLQMGQESLIKSQPLINDLMGQVGRTTYGGYVHFTKDITVPRETVTVDMRLVIMDISQYGDYDVLPVPPEMEWSIIQEVYKLYSTQPIPDKLVDATVKESKNVPLNQQKQR